MNVRIRSIGLLANLLLLASLQTTVRADILVSNLDQAVNSNGPSIIGNGGGDEVWGGQSFFSGVDGVQLTSIFAMTGNGNLSPLVVAQLRLSDISGAVDTSPSALVTTFSAADMSGPLSIRLFVPDSSVILGSSVKYWFILGSGNSGTFDWAYAVGPATSGPGVLSNYSDSSDSGASWILRNDTDPYMMQVNGSSIPEPSSWQLLCTGVVGLMSLVRNRRRLN